LFLDQFLKCVRQQKLVSNFLEKIILQSKIVFPNTPEPLAFVGWLLPRTKALWWSSREKVHEPVGVEPPTATN
jgi:hypothetical protein